MNKEVVLVRCPECGKTTMPEGNHYCSKECYKRAIAEQELIQQKIQQKIHDTHTAHELAIEIHEMLR